MAVTSFLGRAMDGGAEPFHEPIPPKRVDRK